ncbi:MAG: 3-isopropylmalate dehydratase, partial [Candidatus Omnitrophica bacterium]|nr:3-isopropylmalate dehydratase [Candidatus Omnitrophota bacterium]
GSSREQAPLAIKASGIKAVIAPSFARIFYRNAINQGLMLVEADTSSINDGDELAIDLEKNKIKDFTHNREIEMKPLPPLMQEIIKMGGAVEYFKKYGL